MIYLYGIHACVAALSNPQRVIQEIYTTDTSLLQKNIPPELWKPADHFRGAPIIIVNKEFLNNKTPPGAVHQGIVVKAKPLEHYDIFDFTTCEDPHQIIVVLDQVNDPHNVGAILRSAAAFGVKGVVLTHHYAPKESATLAKTASGALEHVPLCIVKNLSQALDCLKKAGFWCVAVTHTATENLSKIDLKGKIVLVLGAESVGIRSLTQKNCDLAGKLPTTSKFNVFNVSNAAAIALYEAYQQQSIS